MTYPGPFSQPEHSEAGGGQSFQRYYRTIREHRWLLAICVVLAVAAAAAYVASASRKYQAQAELLVAPAPPDNPALLGLPVLHSTSDPTRDVLTASSLVTTTDVARAVATSLGTHAPPGSLLQDVQANPIGQSNLVGIQAVASSAAGAQQLADAFAMQTLAVRTAAMHAAIASIIPGLKLQLQSLPVAERATSTIPGQLSQLELLASGKDPTLSLAAPAERPTAPFTPRTKLSLAVGLLAGLILGVGGAFAFDALDPRVQREEQVRDLLPVPVLARLPTVRVKRKSRPIVPEELPIDALEAYRTLRTTIASRGGSDPKAIFVTGSAPEEGKTTTSINLAVMLAQSGARVTLIESDMRRPTFNMALKIRGPHYSTEQVLTGEVSLEEALVPTTVNGSEILVLAAGEGGLSLADRLTYAAAGRMIEEAKAHSDYVVIDSPPLTVVIDALPLAQLADQVIVVVRLGETKLTKLRQLDELLSSQGAPATGLVLIGALLTGGYDYRRYRRPRRAGPDPGLLDPGREPLPRASRSIQE